MEPRRVLVTGAGSGIGAAMVQEFVQRGDAVAVLDVDKDAAEAVVTNLASRNAIAVEADVGDASSIAAAMDQVVNIFGGVDVLCSNAGILDDYLPVLETSESLWSRVIATNLTGAFLMARAVLPGMVAQQRGAIVITASISSFVAGGGGAAYTASKHGVLGLTRQIAFDYGKHNIRANAICPGPVKTGLTRHLFTEEGRQPHVDAAIAATPSGRWSEPAEIAKVAAFLASDDASFVQGAGYVVDGGWTIV